MKLDKIWGWYVRFRRAEIFFAPPAGPARQKSRQKWRFRAKMAKNDEKWSKITVFESKSICLSTLQIFSWETVSTDGKGVQFGVGVCIFVAGKNFCGAKSLKIGDFLEIFGRCEVAGGCEGGSR